MCVVVLLLFCRWWKPCVEVCMDSDCDGPVVQLYWCRHSSYNSCITWSFQVL